MSKEADVLYADYSKKSFRDLSPNHTPYLILGTPFFCRETEWEGEDYSLVLPTGSAIGYLFNNDVYDQYSNAFSVEFLMYYSQEQTRIPNIILGHKDTGGFCFYEMGVAERYGGLIFSVNTYFNYLKAQSLRRDCLYLRGSWHHIVGVFDGRTVYLYINGEQVANSMGDGAICGEICQPAPPNQLFCIGGTVFDGKLQEETDCNIRIKYIKIYSTARSPEEIRQDSHL